MRETSRMRIAIGEIEFECLKQEDGEWYCNGDHDGVLVSIRFPKSAPTHVFQYIENMVKNSI